MASLISRLQKRYIVEGDDLAHDAEACIGELMAAIRYTRDALRQEIDNYDVLDIEIFPYVLEPLIERLDAAMTKCANGD